MRKLRRISIEVTSRSDFGYGEVSDAKGFYCRAEEALAIIAQKDGRIKQLEQQVVELQALIKRINHEQ